MWQPQGIYADFLLYQPTIFWGENAIGGLASFPGSRVAVISSGRLDEKVKDYLEMVFKKKSLFFIRRSWDGEPDLQEVAGTVGELEQICPDVIVAVGGGSVIDGAKICRVLYEFPFYKAGITKLSQLSFKTSFVAVPTTVGSGAEVSSAAVYINGEKGRKEMIVCHELLPSVVILNPECVQNAPEKVIVSSALDALAHIVEGYLSNRNNALTDVLAEKALSILVEELPKKERDYQRIQYAGYLGGVVQNHCIVGAAHAIAHQLSGYGYSHGDAVALLLPYVLKENCKNEDVAARMDYLLRQVGIAGVEDLCTFLKVQADKIGLNAKLPDLRDTLTRLSEDAAFIENVCEDQGGKGNPVPISREYILSVIGGIESGL